MARYMDLRSIFHGFSRRYVQRAKTLKPITLTFRRRVFYLLRDLLKSNNRHRVRQDDYTYDFWHAMNERLVFKKVDALFPPVAQRRIVTDYGAAAHEYL